MARGLDHSLFPQIGEMLRDFRLRDFEDVLKVADAKGPLREQMNDAKTCRITKALINLNEIHERSLGELKAGVNKYMRFDIYMRKSIVLP